MSAHTASESGSEAGKSRIKPGQGVVFKGGNRSDILYGNFVKDGLDFMYKNQDGTYVLSGWHVLDVIDDPQTGYLGVIYVNTTQKQIVLSHRSTAFGLSFFTKNFFKQSGVQEDVDGVLLGNILSHQGHEYLATRKALEHLNEWKGFALSFTGHSLGSWLAQLSVFYCHADLSNSVSFVPSNVKAVVFDGPGSRDMMEKMNVSHSSISKVDLDSLDIVSYFSAPNIVNCTNKHVGVWYRLFPEIQKENFLEALSEGKVASIAGNSIVAVARIVSDTSADAILSTFGHDLSFILPYFDLDSQKPFDYSLVHKWPSISHLEFGRPTQGTFISSFVSERIRDLFGGVAASAYDFLSSKVFGTENTTLESVLSICVDVYHGKIDMSQFWGVHNYLDRASGYRRSTNDKNLDEFFSIYKCNYLTSNLKCLTKKSISETNEIEIFIKAIANAELTQIQGHARLRISELQQLYDYNKMQNAIEVKCDSDKSIHDLFDLVRIMRRDHPEVVGQLSYGPYKIKTNMEFPQDIDCRIINRKSLLESLYNLLDFSKVVILDGPPHTGKTFLSIKYASQQAADYTPVFIPSSSRDFVNQELSRLTESVGNVLLNHKPQQLFDYLHKTAQKVLFIFDDVNLFEDICFFFEALYNLENVRIIITTRVPDLMKFDNVLHVMYITVEDALCYFKKNLSNVVEEKYFSHIISNIGLVPEHIVNATEYLKASEGVDPKCMNLSLFNTKFSSYIQEVFNSISVLKHLILLESDKVPEDSFISKLRELQPENVGTYYEDLRVLKKSSILAKGHYLQIDHNIRQVAAKLSGISIFEMLKFVSMFKTEQIAKSVVARYIAVADLESVSECISKVQDYIEQKPTTEVIADMIFNLPNIIKDFLGEVSNYEDN